MISKIKNLINEYFYQRFSIQFTDTFYIGRKRLPISLKKNNKNKGYTVKLGSGFASYTLDTDKYELEKLSLFVNDFIRNNP